MLFVIWVISAWAIRTRCAELQLLFIKNLSIEVETHVSDDDHSTTVAGDRSGQPRGAAARCGSADKSNVSSRMRRNAEHFRQLSTAPDDDAVRFDKAARE